MGCLETLRLHWRGLLFRRREQQRLGTEIQFHLDALIAENVAAGMPPEEARYTAMRTFGNAKVMNEQTQGTWGWTWVERLVQDIRFAARQIRRARGLR